MRYFYVIYTYNFSVHFNGMASILRSPSLLAVATNYISLSSLHTIDSGLSADASFVLTSPARVLLCVSHNCLILSDDRIPLCCHSSSSAWLWALRQLSPYWQLSFLFQIQTWSPKFIILILTRYTIANEHTNSKKILYTRVEFEECILAKILVWINMKFNWISQKTMRNIKEDLF